MEGWKELRMGRQVNTSVLYTFSPLDILSLLAKSSSLLSLVRLHSVSSPRSESAVSYHTDYQSPHLYPPRDHAFSWLDSCNN